MPPARSTRQQNLVKKPTKKAVSTVNSSNKRSLDVSLENESSKKRTVFEEITNAAENITAQLESKKNAARPQRKCKKNQNITVSKSRISDPKKGDLRRDSIRSNPESALSNPSSPYLTADESLENTQNKTNITVSGSLLSSPKKQAVTLPKNVEDADSELDIYGVSYYATDIFNYYKERESKFAVTKYLEHQKFISKTMRAILVDWLVEVQESFELNHETLYLAVKLVDMYLDHSSGVSREKLQLIGATAIFIACKFDERCPPVVDDFLYICDDAYDRQEFLCMEIKLLKTVDFDLGAPLSYSFLRRYARCAKLPLEILTVARYILETSLMDYDLIDASESAIAAAALLVALEMKNISKWTPTLEYYSGYQKEELLFLAHRLNALITTPIHKNLQTIKTKYSHKVFFEVANIPPVDILIM